MPKHNPFLIAIFGFTVAVACSSANAQSGACQMGAKVTDRQNRSGVVVEAKGSDCRVKLEDGTTHYYLAWMLSPAGAAAKKGADRGLTAGSYQCTAAGSIAGTLKLVIRSQTEYADRNGKTGSYAYSANANEIVFQSGPWAGNFGKKLGTRKIGISSRRGGFSNTVCDLK